MCSDHRTVARPSVDISASCGCGTISIAVKGRIRAMFLCACTECQKLSGSGHTALAIAHPDDVTVTGETRAFARPADSGATVTRHFCPVCGITLYATTSRNARVCLLPAGLFGGADWFRPVETIFARSHLSWDMLPDIPAYDTYREE